MKFGLLKENRNELRTALCPDDVKNLVNNKHQVVICSNCGKVNGFDDTQYIKAGAKIVKNNKLVINESDILIKLSAPASAECKLLKNKIIIGHYNLANNPKALRLMLINGVTSIGIEAINQSGVYPFLLPNEQIKGRFGALVGCYNLARVNKNASGKIFCQISNNTNAANFVIVNASYAGLEAAKTILALGGDLTILENNEKLFSQLKHNTALTELAKNSKSKFDIVNADYGNLLKYIKGCDVLIYTNSLPCSITAKRITNQMLLSMNRGGVFVDVSFDQGVASDDEKKPCHINKPYFIANNVTHFAIDNIPSMFSYSASVIVSKLLTECFLQITNENPLIGILSHELLKTGILTHQTKLINKVIANDLHLEATKLEN